MQKFGQVIRLKPEHYDEYVKAHAEVLPEVLAQIKASHIQNYSIFHHDGLLFAYFEYVTMTSKEIWLRYCRSHYSKNGGRG